MDLHTIAVTGGSGKIGRHLIPELLKAGCRVRALEHRSPLGIPGVEVMRGDLADTSLARRFVAEMDAVIHLANVKETRDAFMSVNVRGTFELLDACKETGSIRQFIQAGSDARAGIYYYPHPAPIDETHPHTAYPGYYALSKVIEETLAEQYIVQYRLPVTILRFSWIWADDDALAHGTLQPPGFGVPDWRELAVTPRQKAFFESGADAAALLAHADGTPGVRHVVSVHDAVAGILRALGNRSALCQAFNIAGPAPFRYDVLADYISRKLGIPVVEFRHDGFHDFEIDLRKSRSVLGFEPQCDMADMVDQAVEFRNALRQRVALKYPG